ncbi:MAG: YgdI/YgdR family lipoprotein [Alicyclobacillus sp.]|nr:YgdI/YgdR family lipoprotein [Alicyclobacillus sp.]
MKMKRIAAVVATLAVFTLAGCGSNGGSGTSNSSRGMGNMDMSNGTMNMDNQTNTALRRLKWVVAVHSGKEHPAYLGEQPPLLD